MQNFYKKQLAGLKNKRQLLIILIFLFIAVIAWTIVGLTSSRNKLQISKELRDMTVPLNPNVDLELIENLEQKKLYGENELKNFPIYKVLSIERGRESRVVRIEFTEEDLEALTQPTPTSAEEESVSPLGKFSAEESTVSGEIEQ